MDARTREQEMRYVMALGYAYGRKDATPYASDSATRTLLISSSDFATFYAMVKDLGGNSQPIDIVWQYFSSLTSEEQKAYGREWARMAYSPYEEMRRIMAERQETTHNA
jgi:hypothetical protein